MYYFRADGNAVTGAGHLMRCLTIADELSKMPNAAGRIHFLCADEASAWLAADRGYNVVVLHTDYRMMEQELPVIAQVLRKPVPSMDEEGQNECRSSVFLVDSYHVTDAYLRGLQAFGRVLLLDDMCKHAFPVDAVINYNAFALESAYEELYRGSVSSGKKNSTCCYVGSSYVPVRPQFLQVEYSVKETVKDVLITTGGGDSENIAAKVLRAVWNPDWCYHVVVGRFNPSFAAWKKWEQQYPQIQVHHDVKDMAGLMSQCDLAVTAGGTTIYELAAIGVPFLCFSYAENQEALTGYIGEKQIAGYCGAYHIEKDATLERMKQLADQIGKDCQLRLKMYENEKMMIDGLGAKRLAGIMAAWSNVERN